MCVKETQLKLISQKKKKKRGKEKNQTEKLSIDFNQVLSDAKNAARKKNKKQNFFHFYSIC